jgi:hypothetical protein
MRLKIVSADGNADEVVSLYRWLSMDPGVGSTATMSLDGCADESGGMCTGNEEINVVVANSLTAVSGFLGAVSHWRSTRSRGAELNIEASTTVIAVGSEDPDELQGAAEQLLAAPR